MYVCAHSQTGQRILESKWKCKRLRGTKAKCKANLDILYHFHLEKKKKTNESLGHRATSEPLVFFAEGRCCGNGPQVCTWQFLFPPYQDSCTLPEIFGKALKNDSMNKRPGGKSGWWEAALQACLIVLGKPLILWSKSPAILRSLRLLHALGINTQDPSGLNRPGEGGRDMH